MFRLGKDGAEEVAISYIFCTQIPTGRTCPSHFTNSANLLQTFMTHHAQASSLYLQMNIFLALDHFEMALNAMPHKYEFFPNFSH